MSYHYEYGGEQSLTLTSDNLPKYGRLRYTCAKLRRTNSASDRVISPAGHCLIVKRKAKMYTRKIEST